MKNGTLEDWKNGRMEGCRVEDGTLEDWKDGRMENEGWRMKDGGWKVGV